MKYIVENWFVIVGLIAVCAAGGYAVYVFVKMPSDKQLNKVREWLLYAVTKAEKELGGGTGQIKLRYVYDMFVARFGSISTVDAETVEKMTTFESDEDAAGQQEDAEDGGTVSNDAETTNPPSEPETGENGANTEPQEAEDEPEDKVIIPQGKMKVTVICDGSLNIRRSAAWGNENICGRAIRGQSYYVKEIHVVDGKKMVRTIGDLYLSGESEHVQFEQL